MENPTRRVTTEVMQIQNQANGIWLKVVVVVIGIVITGSIGGLVAWGGMSSTQQSHEKKIDKLETLSSIRAIGQAKLEANQAMIIKQLEEVKSMIRSRYRGGTR